MKEITLYNHFHNGDIFYSRMITQILSKHFKIKYYHTLPSGLFEDLIEISEHSITGSEIFDKNNSNPENMIVNTWIGQSNFKYYNIQSCSFKSNAVLLSDILKTYDISINDEIELLPIIKYENLSNIEIVKEKISNLKSNFRKIIFISTGNVNSGQSSNFNFSEIVKEISEIHQDYCFITTTNLSLNKENVIWSSEITEKQTDLLLLSFITTESDVIIGRASGPYCFSHVMENVLNVNKTFICFTNIKEEASFYEKSLAKTIWSNNYELNNVINIIKTNI